MNFRKKFCFALLIILSFSCSLSAAEGKKTFVPDESNVKFLGRSYFDKDVLWMCFSSTGASLKVNAKYLEVQIAGDNGASKSNKDSAARVVVFVNGERKADEMILKQDQTIVVFDEVKPVTGEVQILKVSESANSVAGIRSIITDGEGSISPASAKKMKIEFIGDSITCGYGVDDLNQNHHFATSTEDNTKTYAYKAAQSLNADYSMVSISGWGVISGYTSGAKNPNSVLPKVYDKIGFTYGNTFNGKQPANIQWDFKKFVPDVVVINLGTNDHSYTKNNKARVEEFEKGYISFLKMIRGKNPNSKILCVLGSMGADLFPAIENAVKEYKTTENDSLVYTLKLPNQNMADGIAADWHPSEKTHTKAAAILVNKINEIK